MATQVQRLPVGVPPLPGFEPKALRSPARCHDHKAKCDLLKNFTYLMGTIISLFL